MVYSSVSPALNNTAPLATSSVTASRASCSRFSGRNLSSGYSWARSLELTLMRHPCEEPAGKCSPCPRQEETTRRPSDPDDDSAAMGSHPWRQSARERSVIDQDNLHPCRRANGTKRRSAFANRNFAIEKIYH